MCYVSIHEFKMPILNSKTWNIIIKFIKQWFHKVWFSAQLLLIMNAVNHGGKGREGVEWEATLNQGDSPSFPDTMAVICI